MVTPKTLERVPVRASVSLDEERLFPSFQIKSLPLVASIIGNELCVDAALVVWNLAIDRGVQNKVDPAHCVAAPVIHAPAVRPGCHDQAWRVGTLLWLVNAIFLHHVPVKVVAQPGDIGNVGSAFLNHNGLREQIGGIELVTVDRRPTGMRKYRTEMQ